MKYEFRIQLLELKRDSDGEPFGGDPIVYESRATKKAAINYIKKGVQREDVWSGWVWGTNPNGEEFYRAYIYKGDADITDQTGW
jgi:hypothetical protein